MSSPSLGGRSVEVNFVGCHHAANRLEKNDKLLQSLDPVRMNLGIRADQFIALFAYAESRAPPNRRLDKQAERDRVQAWLLRSPRNGKQISNFQLEVQHTTDGERIYLFLENHFEPQISHAIPSTKDVAAIAAVDIGKLLVVKYLSNESFSHSSFPPNHFSPHLI